MAITNGSRNLITVLIAVIALLFGFTVSQITIVGDVKMNTQSITDFKESSKELNLNMRKVLEQNTIIMTRFGGGK